MKNDFEKAMEVIKTHDESKIKKYFGLSSSDLLIALKMALKEKTTW